jgi:murein DD-endopeptidase MepM/ murein hydrolase activator NlpD
VTRALSPAQIAAHVRAAGYPEELVPTKVAIALAESSGNPRAHNPNASSGDDSYGLFQVNMLGGMGPERRREFGLSSNEQLFDPATNARAAKKIYDSQGLGAWSVYRSGAYRRFLPEAQRAAGSREAVMPQNSPVAPAPRVSPAASLEAVAAGILGGASGTGGFRMAAPFTMAPRVAAVEAGGPVGVAGAILDNSFAGAVGKQRMAASSALLPGLFKAATGVSIEELGPLVASAGRLPGSRPIPDFDVPMPQFEASQTGMPADSSSGLRMGRLGGATTNRTRDPDAEQSGYDIVKPGGVGAPIVAPVDLEITGKGFQGQGSGESGRGYGNWLSGKFTGADGKPYELLLGHLNDYSVKPGMKVPRGTVLGSQGVTGRAFGAHVTTHVNALSGGNPWQELDRLTNMWTAPAG